MSDWVFVREQIKERLTLSDIVGRKVRFDARKSQPGRGDYWGCCPFHSEKTPSFHVVDREGFYKCFGCGASGDAFTFVMETENCSISEATERLASEAGVALPKRDARTVQAEQKRLTLHGILERTAQFYQDQLKSEEGEVARTYLRKRGVPVELWQQFRLGYAPNDGAALLRHMKAANVPAQDLREAGLLTSRDEPSPLLRGRLTFSISDSRGRVIAFGGRALREGQQPKYLNTGDSPVFHKSRALYNVETARSRPSQSQQEGPVGSEKLIVVEGYMDAIALAAAGFPRAVAPLGTALTEDQLRILWQITAAPVLCLDGDEAGLRAAERAMARAMPLLKPGKTLELAYLPAGQDPDDLISAKGPGAFSEVLSQAMSLGPSLWKSATRGANLDLPDERARVEADLRNLCEQIADPTVRRHYERFVQDKFWNLRRAPPRSGLSFEKRGGVKPAHLSLRSAAPRMLAPNGQAGLPAEKVLLALLIAHPALAEDEMEPLALVPLSDVGLDKLRSEIIDIAASGEGLDRQGMMDRLTERGLAANAQKLLKFGGFTCLEASRDEAPASKVRETLVETLKMLSLRSDAQASHSAVQSGLSEDSWAQAVRLRRAIQLTKRETIEAMEKAQDAQEAELLSEPQRQE